MNPVDVLVAIPARDESARLKRCLRSVLDAVRFAEARALVHRATVAVAAHCCTDDTAALARQELGRAPDLHSVVWECEREAAVGAVRTGLIRRARRPDWIAGSGRPSPTTWLFSTDADSRVPADWLAAGLRHAAMAKVGMVVGLVDLLEVETDVRLRQAHARLVQAGIRANGSHEHIYAANLAVRMDVFDAVGGFPAVANGEEHALLAAVEAAGHPVLRTSAWRVGTSGRTRGRAEGGLGDLLGRLASSIEEPLDRTA